MKNVEKTEMYPKGAKDSIVDIKIEIINEKERKTFFE